MKKISELMEELGFDPRKPQGAQKAFIKSLLKDAAAQSPRSNKYQETQNLIQLKTKPLYKKESDMKQLAFDLESVGHLSKSKIS
jgi:hypothetical protein